MIINQSLKKESNVTQVKTDNQFDWKSYENIYFNDILQLAGYIPNETNNMMNQNSQMYLNTLTTQLPNHNSDIKIEEDNSINQAYNLQIDSNIKIEEENSINQAYNLQIDSNIKIEEDKSINKEDEEYLINQENGPINSEENSDINEPIPQTKDTFRMSNIVYKICDTIESHQYTSIGCNVQVNNKSVCALRIIKYNDKLIVQKGSSSALITKIKNNIIKEAKKKYIIIYKKNKNERRSRSEKTNKVINIEEITKNSTIQFDCLIEINKELYKQFIKTNYCEHIFLLNNRNFSVSSDELFNSSHLESLTRPNSISIISIKTNTIRPKSEKSRPTRSVTITVFSRIINHKQIVIIKIPQNKLYVYQMIKQLINAYKSEVKIIVLISNKSGKPSRYLCKALTMKNFTKYLGNDKEIECDSIGNRTIFMYSEEVQIILSKTDRITSKISFPTLRKKIGCIEFKKDEITIKSINYDEHESD